MAERKIARRGSVRTLAGQLEEGAGQLLKGWKTQARRPDAVGDASYRGLELVHGGLGFAVRSLTRLEKATQPPHRPPKPEPRIPEHHAPARATPPARPASARRVRREARPSAS